MNKIKKAIFPTIITLSAISVSLSAAFYSVSGLSKLFAGASVEVMVMASSLEVAKLVVASLLYRYWGDLNKLLRTYLVVAVTVLILITSMGIYGFLSAAYQETYNEVSVREAQKDYIQQEIDFYQEDVNRHERELEIIANNIATLSSTRSSSIQVKDTAVRGGYRTTISTSEVRLAQKRIVTEEENRKTIQAKRDKQVDSLQKYQLEILELNNSTDLAGELGPLQYLSNLTGTPMDSIINVLLLIIVFVFDPLAISLVIAANFAFSKAFPDIEENLYGELRDDFAEWNNLDGKEIANPVEFTDKDYEDRHTDDTVGSETIEPEWNIDQAAPKVIKKVTQKGPSKWRVLYTDGTTDFVPKSEVQQQIKENPNKITYMG